MYPMGDLGLGTTPGARQPHARRNAVITLAVIVGIVIALGTPAGAVLGLAVFTVLATVCAFRAVSKSQPLYCLLACLCAICAWTSFVRVPHVGTNAGEGLAKLAGTGDDLTKDWKMPITFGVSGPEPATTTTTTPAPPATPAGAAPVPAVAPR